MHTLDAVFLTLSISHLSIILIVFFAQNRKQYLNQLIATLIICLIAYLLGSAPGEYLNQPIPDYVLRRFGNACPILLWLVARELFADKITVSPVVWLLAAAYILPRAMGAAYFVDELEEFDLPTMLLTYVFPQIIMIYFLLHALYITIKGYNSDLVNLRREERIAFVSGTSILLLLIAVNTTYSITVSTLNISFGTSYVSSFLIPTYFYSAYTYVAILVFGFWRFRLSYPLIKSISKKYGSQLMSDASLINIKNRDKKIIENIIYVMESHKLYLTNKLTVKDLASHISNQEYRVRRAINVHMQYRNFSDFINHYRILEAGRRLIGTDTSISNIGLEVGYTSLSVFHKAFKQTYGVTPKEYRIRQQVNSPRGIDTQTA